MGLGEVRIGAEESFEFLARLLVEALRHVNRSAQKQRGNSTNQLGGVSKFLALTKGGKRVKCCPGKDLPGGLTIAQRKPPHGLAARRYPSIRGKARDARRGRPGR